MPRITVAGSDASFECTAGDTILRAALREGIGMPYSCNVGSCGNCRFELVEGAVDHARADAPAWSERDLKRNRWLGCQAIPQGDCTVKFRSTPDALAPARPALRQAQLVSVEDVTRDIREFRFAVEGPDAFEPGQYALISAPQIASARAYSMANLPGDGLWHFQIKRVPGGALTGYLFDTLAPGGTVTLDGPYGTAYLRPDSPRDLILMAGGSGLSPMVSIARGAAATGLTAHRKVHFLYGCRSRADLFDPSLVTSIDPAISLTAVLSEPDAGWDGATGFLHDHADATFGAALAEAEIYFAGPAAMSGAIQRMAHDSGVPMTQLHFDEFY